MKLLINALALKGPYCGYDTVVFEILNYLRENDACRSWSITVLANSKLKERFSDYESVFHIRYCSKWNSSYWFRGIYEQVFVALYSRLKGIEVVYSPTNYGNLFLSPKTRQCTTFHTTQNFDLPPERVRRKIESKLINFLSVRSMRVSQSITFVSEFTRERFIEFAANGDRDYADSLKKKSRLIYNGVKYNRETLPREYLERKFLLNRPYAMYTSSLYPFKNHLLLVKTWVELISSGKTSLDLIIVGGIIDTEYYDQIKKYMDEVPGRIRHYQNISDEELASLYANSSVYICPSQYETFGLTPLEALAHEKPVVLSDITVFREVYGSINPLWLDISTEDRFKMSLLKALRSSDQLERGEVRDLLRKFSWAEIVKEYADVFAELTTASL